MFNKATSIADFDVPALFNIDKVNIYKLLNTKKMLCRTKAEQRRRALSRSSLKRNIRMPMLFACGKLLRSINYSTCAGIAQHAGTIEFLQNSLTSKIINNERSPLSSNASAAPVKRLKSTRSCCTNITTAHNTIFATTHLARFNAVLFRRSESKLRSAPNR